MLKSCFLGGLKRELQYDVKLLRPSTMHDDISIAFQVDAKLNALVLPQLHAPQPRTPTLP